MGHHQPLSLSLPGPLLPDAKRSSGSIRSDSICQFKSRLSHLAILADSIPTRQADGYTGKPYHGLYPIERLRN